MGIVTKLRNSWLWHRLEPHPGPLLAKELSLRQKSPQPLLCKSCASSLLFEASMPVAVRVLEVCVRKRICSTLHRSWVLRNRSLKPRNLQFSRWRSRRRGQRRRSSGGMVWRRLRAFRFVGGAVVEFGHGMGDRGPLPGQGWRRFSFGWRSGGERPKLHGRYYDLV
jgi:hypothetical protein